MFIAVLAKLQLQNPFNLTIAIRRITGSTAKHLVVNYGNVVCSGIGTGSLQRAKMHCRGDAERLTPVRENS
jgi:hypothetical protein